MQAFNAVIPSVVIHSDFRRGSTFIWFEKFIWVMSYRTLSMGLKYWDCGLCVCHRPFELSGMTGLPFQTKLF